MCGILKWKSKNQQFLTINIQIQKKNKKLEIAKYLFKEIDLKMFEKSVVWAKIWPTLFKKFITNQISVTHFSVLEGTITKKKKKEMKKIKFDFVFGAKKEWTERLMDSISCVSLHCWILFGNQKSKFKYF